MAGNDRAKRRGLQGGRAVPVGQAEGGQMDGDSPPPGAFVVGRGLRLWAGSSPRGKVQAGAPPLSCSGPGWWTAGGETAGLLVPGAIRRSYSSLSVCDFGEAVESFTALV